MTSKMVTEGPPQSLEQVKKRKIAELASQLVASQTRSRPHPAVEKKAHGLSFFSATRKPVERKDVEHGGARTARAGGGPSPRKNASSPAFPSSSYSSYSTSASSVASAMSRPRHLLPRHGGSQGKERREELNSKLNPMQREAVDSNAQALMILAAAGSGKTLTLTARIARLLLDGVPATSILVLTFTKEAVREMQTRIHSLIGFRESAGLTVKNFHQLGLSMVGRHYNSAGFKSRPIIVVARRAKAVVRGLVLFYNAFHPEGGTVPPGGSSRSQSSASLSRGGSTPAPSQASNARANPGFTPASSVPRSSGDEKGGHVQENIRTSVQFLKSSVSERPLGSIQKVLGDPSLAVDVAQARAAIDYIQTEFRGAFESPTIPTSSGGSSQPGSQSHHGGNHNQNDRLPPRYKKQVSGEEVKMLLNSISHAKRDKTGEVVATQGPKFRFVYTKYCELLNHFDAVDFQDMVPMSISLLKNNEAVLRHYRDMYRHVLCDEYQDVSDDQVELLELLAGPNNSITVCGDDDQSIYSWRGASVHNFSKFEQMFPHYKTVVLHQMYRCSGNIVSIADCLIKNNQVRREKRLHTSNDAGENVRLLVCRDPTDEGQQIANEIKFLRETRCIPYKDIVVLSRAHVVLQQVEKELLKAGIPIKAQSHVHSPFIHSTEAKLVLSYFLLIEFFRRPHDDRSAEEHKALDEAFNLTCNTPKRGLGKTTIDRFKEVCQIKNAPVAQCLHSLLGSSSLRQVLSEAQARKLASFAAELKSLADYSETNRSASAVLSELTSRIK